MLSIFGSFSFSKSKSTITDKFSDNRPNKREQNIMGYSAIYCVRDDFKKAQDAYKALSKHYHFIDDPASADVIVVLGGDGFMLHSMHKFMNMGVPIYGMNCGTVGFLMNPYLEGGLVDRLEKAKKITLYPLHMEATTKAGKTHNALAFNEVSLLRQSKQAAQLQISVDSKVRMDELVCDGALIATPAGSTAYNLSAHGPILPIRSELLALTPISPFRPRRWRGALISHRSDIQFDILDSDKRPVSAVADFTEVRYVTRVRVKEDRSKQVTLLFDSNHSLEERSLNEQFIV